MTYVVGIDPGLGGAITLLDNCGELLDCYDMPTFERKSGTKNVRQVSAVGVAVILRDIKESTDRDGVDLVVAIENVFNRPGEGTSSSFKFGHGKGILEGVCAGLEIRYELVTPAKWKRDLRVTSSKGHAREVAMNRWPSEASAFKRVKDDGRAESALIALWQVTYGS